MLLFSCAVVGVVGLVRDTLGFDPVDWSVSSPQSASVYAQDGGLFSGEYRLVQGDGSVRWVLSARPVVALGRISYGVYLFHWPVYVVLDEARIGRGGVALFAARIAVTLAIATVSYVAIERPVRTSGWSLPRVGVLAVSATAVTIALTLVEVPLDRNDFGGDENAAEQVTISPTTACPDRGLNALTLTPKFIGRISASTCLPLIFREICVFAMGPLPLAGAFLGRGERAHQHDAGHLGPVFGRAVAVGGRRGDRVSDNQQRPND